LAPQRRQKRAVEDSGRPQLTQAWTPVSGRLRTSRLEAAQMASAALSRLARGWLAGQPAVGEC
jgi:hypothetical protein